MAVQVMIKRKFKVESTEELFPLLTELRIRAKDQPGYISGETLRSLDNPQDYLVFSKWETADDWKKWFNSKERRDIQGRVDSMIGEKTFYEIFESVSH
ncbi:MAG: antibiotic biosynthesis monooxygenase [Deltaproteobacteria bacterium]|nr:antibiotic biosynthesis monooxygenase [Deltaproteobacteria bacterium]MBW2564074.1 antibiotic biosynthesis monooxygenase [Deltaproteobacteria bacterium]